ncbi:MAG: hypothetical protein ACRDJW_23080 [Thermomicrobiales bacterium]
MHNRQPSNFGQFEFSPDENVPYVALDEGQAAETIEVEESI